MKAPFIISRKTLSMCTVWRALGKKNCISDQFYDTLDRLHSRTKSLGNDYKY